MKYKFHVGDYVELKDGRCGYIAEIQCSTFSVHLIGLNPKLVSMMYPLLDNFHFYSNNFIRIGQYDFTKKNKVEPLLINKNVSMYCGNGKTNSPFDYKKVFEQNELNDKVIDKINELVDALNRLDEKVNGLA